MLQLNIGSCLSLVALLYVVKQWLARAAGAGVEVSFDLVYLLLKRVRWAKKTTHTAGTEAPVWT